MLTYSSLVWSLAVLTHLKGLQVVQKVTRMATYRGTPRYVPNEHIHRKLKVLTVEESCRAIGQCIFENAIAHINITISEFVQYRPKDRSMHNRRLLNALVTSSVRP